MIILDKILEQVSIIKKSFDTVLKNNFSDYMLICAPLKEKQSIINKAKL